MALGLPLSGIESLSERLPEYNQWIGSLAQESHLQVALLKKVKVWARQGVCCRSEAEGGVRIQSQYHLPFERQCHQVTPHTNQSAATIHGTGGTAS